MGVIKVYNTVSDMKLDTTLVVNDVCKTLGYYSIGDGGGTEYFIKLYTGKEDTNINILLNNSNLIAMQNLNSKNLM